MLSTTAMIVIHSSQFKQTSPQSDGTTQIRRTRKRKAALVDGIDMAPQGRVLLSLTERTLATVLGNPTPSEVDARPDISSATSTRAAAIAVRRHRLRSSMPVEALEEPLHDENIARGQIGDRRHVVLLPRGMVRRGHHFECSRGAK